MTVQELITRLQALITEDPAIADLDVYTWTETQEMYAASAAAEDWESDGPFADGAVRAVVVLMRISKRGRNLGSFVAIRSVQISERPGSTKEEVLVQEKSPERALGA